MRAYKGLHKDTDGTLFCKDKIYEPRKTYKFDGKIELCKRGFHACHELYQAWQFYPNNGNNVFWEVECGGNIIESDCGDGKFVCSKITLIKEVDMSDVDRFYGASFFSEGFACIQLDCKWNHISTDGKLLSNKWFDDAWNFSEGFAAVKLDGKYNFINTEGKLLSEQWFDDVGMFLEGFAIVELWNKWNFIDQEGKILSERWFDGVSIFSEGFASVKLDAKWMCIDKTGKIFE